MKRCTGYLTKRGSTWYACWTANGQKFTRTTGEKDKRDAEQVLARMIEPFHARNKVEVLQNLAARIDGQTADLARIEAEANPPLTIATAWTAYRESGNSVDVSSGTMRNYLSYWEKFADWISKEYPTVKSMQAVTLNICERFKRHMISQKVTGRTFNAYRSFFQSFWNTLADKVMHPTEYTLRDGRITRNPWAKLTKMNEDSKSRRSFTVEELLGICRAAKGELRLLLAFGIYTGARLGDVACMNWGNVDLVLREVRYIPRKTARKIKTALIVPIHPELFAMLAEIPSAKRRGPILPGIAKQYNSESKKDGGIRGANYVSAMVQDHFEKCGIETTAKREGAGVRPVVLAGFHSLRHTYVSLLRNGGAALSTSQALVGHNSEEVHQLYTHADKSAMQRAVDALPNVLTKKALPAGREPVPAWVREKLAAMTGKTWKAVRDELLKVDAKSGQPGKEGAK